MDNLTPFIQVNKLDFAYPDGTRALADINVSIQVGEFIALIGQNGSGKTTLSKCLNGLYKPTSGEVIVDGLNSKQTPVVQMVRRVGYVFQNPDHQLFNNNCWDEIAYGPRNIQLSEDEVKIRVEEAAHVVGLPEVCMRSIRFFFRKDSASGWRLPPFWPCARRSSSSTSPRPARIPVNLLRSWNS